VPIPDEVLPPEPMPEPASKKAPTIDEIYKACNASLTCAIECPNPKHTPEDCKSCGNEECVIAYQELETIWQKTN